MKLGSQPVTLPSLFAGGGEMRQLVRAFDWSRTRVGPPTRWSKSLQTTLGILLNSRHPMFLFWGPELVQFYNDGYRPSLTDRHPAALGARGREFWTEIWHLIGPQIDAVMTRGESTWHDDQLLPILRNGRIQDVYWTYSYSPVHDDDGAIGGTLVVVQEQTARVISERRLRMLRDLAARSSAARSEREAWAAAAAALARNPQDLPWTRLYAVGEDGGEPMLVDRTDVDQTETPGAAAPDLADAIRRVAASGRPAAMGDGAWLVPIRRPGGATPRGVLVAGLSPRLEFDDDYRAFLSLVAEQIATSVASAVSYETARDRAESLAALDRAKTSFFSNVSHEFRTPLTLMIGPTEEALATPERALAGDQLESVYRNARRLLRLVNTLLDFSRIEAGRVEAAFAPADLSALTIDLASAFRSTVERAGMRLDVECGPLPAPVYVDRVLWEQIVLNLISNAFKFTLAGAITVSLRWHGTHVTLAVADTGTGISQEELPHIFERFRRVEQARGRTHEGSGIGLSLVQELVTMHGGAVAVSSTLGAGSTFTVTLPTGTSHLPADRIRTQQAPSTAPAHALPFVEEALRWLPRPLEPAVAPATLERAATQVAYSGERPMRVLVADDNADMREYLRGLLQARWSVDVVANGQEALDSARERPPDLVITDVMMPALDGFGLLRELRLEERTARVPVILLTARAGEEARIDGWTAGADDYLVKPFSARELMARVEAQLLKAKLRSVEDVHAARLAGVFAHAPVGIAILRGPEHVYEFANAAYVELLAGRAVVGKPVREALPELASQDVYELLDGVYRSGLPHVGRSLKVVLNRGAQGAAAEAFFDFVYQPIPADGGGVDGIAIVVYDVTELANARRRAEDECRLKELALESGRLGSWQIDLRTLDRWSSDRCKANFGLSPDAPLSYQDVIRAQHPDDREHVRLAMASAIASHTDYVAEYRVIWPDGSCHSLSARGRTLYTESGEPWHMAGNTLDVTEQQQLLETLRQARDDMGQRVAERTAELTERNAELALALEERTALERARDLWLGHLINAQEEERKRVARELHDEMGQHLTGLMLGLHELESAGPGRMAPMLTRLKDIVSATNRAAHRLASGLRPAALDDLGLVAALGAYVEEWSDQTGVAADFCARNCEQRLPLPVETTIYRTVQEALTNVARHADAHNASVVIECKSDRVMAIVEDDGRGFDADAVPSPGDADQFGLVGIRERAALLGGDLRIESMPTGGTTVFISLPLALPPETHA